MQFFTVPLPTKTYLKKYLTSIYGEVRIPSDNTFSDVLLAMMASNFHVKLGKLRLDEQLGRYCDKLPIKFQPDLFYRLPNALSEHNIIRINRYFENKFKEDFCSAVERMTWMGLDRQTAIEHFAEAHSIELEVDVTFDALKKMEYRYRKEKEEKSLAQLSPANLLFQNA